MLIFGWKGDKMNREEYYTAPSEEIFNDIKENAIKIWKTYDDTFGYVTKKLSRIENINNIEDMVAMFDHINQATLL